MEEEERESEPAPCEHSVSRATTNLLFLSWRRRRQPSSLLSLKESVKSKLASAQTYPVRAYERTPGEKRRSTLNFALTQYFGQPFFSFLRSSLPPRFRFLSFFLFFPSTSLFTPLFLSLFLHSASRPRTSSAASGSSN